MRPVTVRRPRHAVLCLAPLCLAPICLTGLDGGAQAQDRTTIDWAEPKALDPQASPLQHRFGGIPGSGSTRATVETPRDGADRRRFVSAFARGGYLGAARVIRTEAGYVWAPSTATSVAHTWVAFAEQAVQPRDNGRVGHGRIELAWILFDARVGGGPRACAVYAGAFEIWRMDGWVCAPVGAGLTPAEVAAHVRSVGFDGLAAAVPVALSPVALSPAPPRPPQQATPDPAAAASAPPAAAPPPAAPPLPAAPAKPPTVSAAPATPPRPAPGTTPAGTSPSGEAPVAERLAALQRLRAKGVITQQELVERRRAILQEAPGARR